MTRRYLWIPLFASLALAVAACGTVVEGPVPLAESANVTEAQAVAFDAAKYERGITLYLTAYCGSCHQLSAAETRGAFGPSHDGAATLAAERLQDPEYTGTATTAAEYLAESIVNPLVYFTPTYAGSAHRMPAYTNLTEDEVDAIVYMLLQQQ